MALWGNKDGEDMGTIDIQAVSGANVTFAASIAAYDIQSGDTIIIDRAGTPEYLRVKHVHSTTLIEMTTNVSTSSVAGGDEYAEWSQAPKYTPDSDVTGGLILGASTTEAAAGIDGLVHAGWVKKHTKTRLGVTTTWYETLVASSSVGTVPTATDVAGTDF